jgi:hypothetical protein
VLCDNEELGLDGVDLVKDPTDSGSLTRSTTLKSSRYKALLFHFFQVDIQRTDRHPDLDNGYSQRGCH